MRVISRKALREAAEKHPALEGPLSAWYKVVSAADWRNFVDVRRTYSSADYVPPFTVFNIKGNRYRLIVDIDYKRHLVFIKRVFTHEEYDQWSQKK